MDFQQLRAVARVAELGSFTRAAEQIGLARGRVSEQVQQLESRIGARLLVRTTRKVTLTPEGEQFLERCRALLDDAEALQGLFAPAGTRGLRGSLRIDLPLSLARNLVLPRLPEFLAEHPGLEVAVSTNDRRVDLIQEGFDCVLRVGKLSDSSLVSRPLGWMPMCNVAAPSYLREHGVPRRLDDLRRHRVVHYAGNLSHRGAGWDYVQDGKARLLPMACTLVVNSTDAYMAGCLAGLGLIQIPKRGIQALVEGGALVEVLPKHRAPAMPVSLLYAHRRHLAPRVRAMLDWLTSVDQPTLSSVAD